MDERKKRCRQSFVCRKRWLLNHPGRVITQFQVAEIFAEAYEKSATMGKALTGFKVCGIFPFNKDIFSEEDFLPSSVTDQPVEENNPSQACADESGAPDEVLEEDVVDNFCSVNADH
ncbi:hypothetical protein J6590_008155 [Homalodisca vitripennis]|nr:hypothetical protein J6590_008155 [Homalodisca vitripennis]